MTPSDNAGIRQYQQIDTHSSIAAATPHRLIQLMMERALAKMGIAKNHMEREEVREKGDNIGDAISIISGLQASLNHNANARLSANFDELYSYMMRRLLEANLRDDPSILDEVSGLLQELKEAWDAITDEVESQVELET
ncbi:MAG: flagellar export chaperone FliS [Woeseiaceae bacterium]